MPDDKRNVDVKHPALLPEHKLAGPTYSLHNYAPNPERVAAALGLTTGKDAERNDHGH